MVVVWCAGQLTPVVVVVGGMIFLAHCARVLGFFVLVRVGLAGMPSHREADATNDEAAGENSQRCVGFLTSSGTPPTFATISKVS